MEDKIKVGTLIPFKHHDKYSGKTYYYHAPVTRMMGAWAMVEVPKKMRELPRPPANGEDSVQMRIADLAKLLEDEATKKRRGGKA